MKNKIVLSFLFSMAVIFTAHVSFADKTLVKFGTHVKAQDCTSTGLCDIKAVGTKDGGAPVTWASSPIDDSTITVTMTFDTLGAIDSGKFQKNQGPQYVFNGTDYRFEKNDGTGIPEGFILAGGTTAVYTTSKEKGILTFTCSNVSAAARARRAKKKK